MFLKDTLVLVLMVLMTLSTVQGEAEVRRSSRHRGSGSNGGFGNFDLSHLPHGLRDILISQGMDRFTPAPVRPDEVDCQVGVEETFYHDGRCIQLAGQNRQPACQAGTHLDIYNVECIRQAIANSRHPNPRRRGSSSRSGPRRTGGRRP